MGKFNTERFERVPIIGILRNMTPDDIMEVLPRYAAAGLTTIEITLNSPDALRCINSAVRHYGAELNVGGGTVCNIDDLKMVLDVGASFIVTPIMDERVIKECAQLGIPIFPGATTPTEIAKAWSLGATMVKVFPANVLGPDYLKAIKAPLNHVLLLATGGIEYTQMGSYWSAGVDGFGVGSPLFPKQLIDKKDWKGLLARFKSYAKHMEDLVADRGRGFK